jgi:DNA mismatch repair protein MutL
MLEVEGSNNDYSITGYISLPEVYKSNRNSIITIVNGRIVKNTELNRAINDAYHSYKPDNYYPIVVLNINVDTTLVDVNIHPTKMDIKFGNIEELLSLVTGMINDRLKVKTLIPRIEDKPVVVKEVKKVEEFTLNFDIPIVNEKEEEYIVNADIVEQVKDEIEEENEVMPMMYPIGLIHGTYIICQNEIGMYIIDQHAAKERINYEIIKEKLNNPKVESMPMMFPLTLEYTNSEYIILRENFEFLKELNFNIEEFGINSIIVKSHPVWLPTGNEDKAIKKILELVIEKEKKFDLGKFNDNVAATMACKMSIKANTSSTLEEMESLISDLRKCKNPFNCPHGRPTIIVYSITDLEKLFKRSGF